MILFVLFFLLLELDLALDLTHFGLLLALLLHLSLGFFPLDRNSDCLIPALVGEHVLALAHALVPVGILLLFLLLLKQFLDECVFLLLLVKARLSVGLVDGQLATASLALLPCEV